MFNDNPYRILGVVSNSGLKIIQKNLSKIKAYSKIGKQIKLSYDLDHLNLNKPDRNDKSIIDAENKILIDKNRVKYALFWFVNFNTYDEVALDKLDSGEIEKSESIWTKHIKGKPVSKSNFSSYNNLSTLFFLKSLDTSKNNQFLNNAESKKLLAEAIKLKSELIFSEHFNSFSKLITGNEDCISKDQIVGFFNESILSILNKNFDVKEVSSITKGSNEKLSQSLNFSLINDPLNKINGFISKANDEVNNDNSNGVSIGKQLIKDTLNPLKTLKEILGNNDIKYQSISDKLANQIMQCGILCFNKTHDDKDYLSSYKYAKSISFKESTIERANTTIEHCQNELKANICGFCSNNDVGDKSLRIQMHKMDFFTNKYSYFKNGGLEVKCCNGCYKDVQGKSNLSLIYTLLVYAFVNGITMLFSDGVPIILILDIVFAFWGAPFFWIGKWVYKQFRKPYFDKLNLHPLLIKCKIEGYQFGMP